LATRPQDAQARDSPGHPIVEKLQDGIEPGVDLWLTRLRPEEP
jgi:hypothetical protein